MRFESLTYGNVQEFHTKDLYFHVTFVKGAPEPNSHKFDVILNFYSLPLELKLEFKGNSQFCRTSPIVRRPLYLKCDISHSKVTIVFKSYCEIIFSTGSKYDFNGHTEKSNSKTYRNQAPLSDRFNPCTQSHNTHPIQPRQTNAHPSTTSTATTRITRHPHPRHHTVSIH